MTETGFQVMSWGHWTMEPLGASVAGDPDMLSEVLEHARAHRGDVPGALTPAHLAFAAECVRLSAAILTRNNFRAALDMLDDVLERLWATEAPALERLSA
jgi:hypothetical protein